MRGKILQFFKNIFKRNPKITAFVFLFLVIIIGQSLLVQAFEAHVINVTARICRSSETRTPGYWKNHSEVYAQYLPTYLGGCEEDIMIDTVTAADNIFVNANAKDMRRKLEFHLLAMKFNIAHYGVGDYQYYVESYGTHLTINEIVTWADNLLRDCQAKRKDLEEVKDILDYLNNLHQLRFCGTIIPTTMQTFQFTEEEVITEEEIVIEEEAVVTERVTVPSCEAESQQLCFTSLLGICAAGTQTCTVEGDWSECIQDNQPTDEICDNQLDDDCDGLTDCEDEFCTEDLSCQPAPSLEGENSTSTESTVATSTEPTSTSTATTTEEATSTEPVCEPTDEVCDDGVDNDCDGLIDCDDDFCLENEVCQLSATTTEEQATTTEPVTECTPDAAQPCSMGLLGICEAGTQTCNAEGFWGECIQDNQSVDEVCDNQLDDNCDGSVDCDDSTCTENPSCQPAECMAGETQSCETGQLGICASGTKTCSAEGFWGECQQDNQPTEEICNNGLDDNCDGNIDCGDNSCLEDEFCLPPAE